MTLHQLIEYLQSLENQDLEVKVTSRNCDLECKHSTKDGFLERKIEFTVVVKDIDTSEFRDGSIKMCIYKNGNWQPMRGNVYPYFREGQKVGND